MRGKRDKEMPKRIRAYLSELWEIYELAGRKDDMDAVLEILSDLDAGHLTIEAVHWKVSVK